MSPRPKETTMTTTTITPDFDEARYAVAGWPGVAFYLTGWPQRWIPATYLEVDGQEYECDDGEGEWEDDTTSGDVMAVMVGDDRKHQVAISDLTLLDENVCSCGQIGCGWDAADN